MAYPTSGLRTTYVGTEAIGDVVAAANYNKSPGGSCGYAEIQADSTPQSGTNTVSGLTVTFGASNTRFYKITIACWGVVNSAVANVSMEIWDMTAGVSLGAVGLLFAASASNWAGDTCTAYHQPASSGSRIYAFRTSASSGTAGILANGSGSSVRRAYILVEDVGVAF